MEDAIKRKVMYSSRYMPLELVAETLIRVPVKSVLRFRSLSRSCNALITSTEFIHSHHNWATSKESNLVLLVHLDLSNVDRKETRYTLRVDDEAFGEYRTLNPPPHEGLFKNLKVIASCNGLVCLVDEGSPSRARNIVLWNPCVNKCVVLPRNGSMSLECVALGFRFDSDSKDFKVFRVFQCGDHREAEVYSLRKRSWKAVDVIGDFAPPICFCSLYGRFVQCVYNNVVHHLANYIIARDRTRWRCTIMFMFDSRHDSVSMVEIPLLAREIETVFVYNGCLAVLEKSFRSFGYRYRVWVLEEYGDMSSWKNKFVFEMKGWIGNVSGCRKNGEILMWDRDKRLVSYDPESQRITNMQGAPGLCIRAVTYVESLVLVDEESRIEHLSSPNSSNKRKRELKSNT